MKYLDTLITTWRKRFVKGIEGNDSKAEKEK